MIQTIIAIAIIIMFVQAAFFNKKRAKNKCLEFSKSIREDAEAFEQLLYEIINNRSGGAINGLKSAKGRWYLIEKNGSGITVHSLNNSRKQTLLARQYEKLLKELDINNPDYDSFLESYSIYYRLPAPNENIILRIDY